MVVNDVCHALRLLFATIVRQLATIVHRCRSRHSIEHSETRGAQFTFEVIDVQRQRRVTDVKLDLQAICTLESVSRSFT